MQTANGKPPAGEVPQHTVGGGSPDRSELSEEERAIIRRLLRQAGVKPTQEIVGRLIDAVQALMATFRQAAPQSSRRKRHDALRAMLRLAEDEDPSVAVIRKRIAELSAVDIAEAEGRARRLWPRVFPGQSLESGFDFVAWSRTAPKAKLLEAVLSRRSRNQ